MRQEIMLYKQKPLCLWKTQLEIQAFGLCWNINIISRKQNKTKQKTTHTLRSLLSQMLSTGI